MKKNSFVEGTFIATLAIVFTKILGMLYVIPFYATIGTQGSALYSYAYNIYVIFLSISSAGIPTAMSKLVSEYDTKEMKEAKTRAFKMGIAIIGVISLISFLILLFFAESIAKLIIGDVVGGNSLADITLVIFVISFSVLIIPFLSVARGYLQGHKYIQVSSNSQMIEQIVRIFVILVGSFTAIKLMHSSVTVGVAFAVSGSFVGGLFAILYVFKKIFKNRKALGLQRYEKKDKVSNKQILKKILGYAIPFVIINITVNVYNTVDMSLIIRTLAKLGFTGAESEYVASVVTTWGYKLNMIVNAVSTGLIVSLIPNIVSKYTNKDYKGVNNILNKAIQIVLFCTLPAACGLSFLAGPVWNVFYGYNSLGVSVFTVSILTAIFCNAYLVIIQAGQALSKYKTVYLGVLAGFITNALLDVPLMYLCYNLNIPAYYGASFATMLGYILSIVIIMKELKKLPDSNYKTAFNSTLKIAVSTIIMLVVLCLLKLVLPLNVDSRFGSIISIVIYVIVGGLVYLTIMYKTGMIKELFGSRIMDRLLKIVTFGHYKKKED